MRRFQIITSEDGSVSSYTHLGSKIGVLVEFTGMDASGAQTGRDVAMQVAAMNPITVSRDEITKDAIEHELEIYRIQAKNEGKKDPIVERIATGRLEKYYQEVCLLDQTFIKDPGKTVKDVLADQSKASGKATTVRRFVRFHLGEEVK